VDFSKAECQGVGLRSAECQGANFSKAQFDQQDRYKEITGRDAPVRSNEAVPRDQIDKVARLQISQELGHNRVSGGEF
jgi:hypothetical protein